MDFFYGHRRLPEDTGVTVKFLMFPVEANATALTIVCDGDPGAPPRADGGDRNDVDLYLSGAGSAGEITSSATPQINEKITLDKVQTIAKGGVGDWMLTVDCYSGTNVAVTITIEVRYS